MNGYICFYKGKRIEVRAFTKLQAQEEAKRRFKTMRGWDITIMLAEKNGETVTHIAVD